MLSKKFPSKTIYNFFKIKIGNITYPVFWIQIGPNFRIRIQIVMPSMPLKSSKLKIFDYFRYPYLISMYCTIYSIQFPLVNILLFPSFLLHTILQLKFFFTCVSGLSCRAVCLCLSFVPCCLIPALSRHRHVQLGMWGSRA